MFGLQIDYLVPMSCSPQHCLFLFVRSFANIACHGCITGRGDSILRWILVECVHSHVRFAPHSDISMFYYRIKKKSGGGKAAVAAASKLLCVIWWMLKEKRGFVTNYS